jgi:hypothetical protein
MKILLQTLKLWLPLAAAVTLLCGVIYIAVQQDLRLGANEIPLQLAEDAAAALAGQQPAASVVPAAKVDIAQSLAPYLIVFDPNGSPLVSNATLHGSIPPVPSGVFDYTRQNGEDRITYMPESGVRSAAVVVAVSDGQGGFVFAGRSLREVESRIDLLTAQIAGGWLVTLAATLVLVLLFELLPATRSQ